jgi:hypothetical protein
MAAIQAVGLSKPRPVRASGSQARSVEVESRVPAAIHGARPAISRFPASQTPEVPKGGSRIFEVPACRLRRPMEDNPGESCTHQAERCRRAEPSSVRPRTVAARYPTLIAGCAILRQRSTQRREEAVPCGRQLHHTTPVGCVARERERELESAHR